VSIVLQFQFYEALCGAAGYNSTDPLHPLYKCDFNGSLVAGQKFA